MEMKMNLFRTTIAAVALTASLVAANAAAAYERWINIHNVGDVAIVAVQVSDIGRDDWGPDILRGDIPVGYYNEVDPPQTRGYCRFDIRLTYDDGSTSDIYDVNLCEAVDLVTDGYTYRLTTI
jgi:hypothetical protein